jgi:hypothetical protein
MFSLTTLQRLRSQVTLCQDEVTKLEEQSEQARASLAEWTALLSHAEAHATQEAPVEVDSSAAADPVRAPFEPYTPPPSWPTLQWPGVDHGEQPGGQAG